MIDKDFIKSGVVVGLTWFVINVLFDSLILIPMMHTSFQAYFMTIGLSYLSIPILSTSIGYLLEKKANT